MAHRNTRTVDGKIVRVGRLMIDRKYGSVGRIHRSSGTKSSTTYKRVLELFDDLHERRHLEPLIAVRDGLATPLEVFEYFRGDRSSPPPWKVDNTLLVESFEEWLDSPPDLAPLTLRSYRSSLNSLQKVCNRKTLKSELPQVLRKFRDRCIREGVSTHFNRTKAACQSFVRNTENGTRGPLYLELKDINAISEKPQNKKSKNNPFTPTELDAAKRDRGVRSELLDVVWFLCLTGMGWKEFAEDSWELDGNGKSIIIYGQKRAARYARRVPLVFANFAPQPYCGYRQFFRDLKSAFPDHTPYDGRRTFRVWCNKAGIEEHHANAYMGHGKTLDETYLQEKVTSWLDEDAQKLSVWLEAARKDLPDLEKARFHRRADPYVLTDTLHDKKLEEFENHLQDIVDRMFLEGDMRRHYWVELKESGFTRRDLGVGKK